MNACARNLRGAAPRMAIRNAFQRASATIIDCNITHLIAAVVLYAIAPEQVKSFAVTLFLGVTISMFTSVFMARVISTSPKNTAGSPS